MNEAARASQALAEGLLDTRLTLSSDDEFGRWASSFNTMAAALEDTIADLAARVLDREPNLLELDDAQALHVAREIAYELQFGEIRASLERFNVHFDVFTSERRLHAVDDDGHGDDPAREAGRGSHPPPLRGRGIMPCRSGSRRSPWWP